MPGFEEEAFARAQRMSRSRAGREKQDIPKEPSGSEPEKEKTPLPIPEQSSKKEIKSDPAPQKRGFAEALFRDKEKSIILALILLLGDESGDPSLLLALAYLLI